MTNRVALLTDIIYNNPGLHFSEIIRISGIKNGVLTHYIKKLESQGTIKIQREKRKTIFFSPRINPEEITIIKFLRRDTSREILFMWLDEELQFKQLEKNLGKSPSTLSHNLRKLIQDDLILAKLDGSLKKYFIKNIPLVKKLSNEYKFR